MVIDRSGFDVTPTILGSKDEVKAHAETVLARNTEIAQSNKAIASELLPLRKSLSAKNTQLAKCTDADAKNSLQAEIADLKQQVSSCEAKKQSFIVIIGPTKFSKREQADSYIEQVRQEADKAKSKSEAAKSATRTQG